MKHRLSALGSLPRVPTVRPTCTPLLFRTCSRGPIRRDATARPLQARYFAITSHLRREDPSRNQYNNSNARPAAELNENITQEEKDHFAKKLDEDKGKQIRTPWHREGSDQPPVARQRSAGAMTKGTFTLKVGQTPEN